MTTIKKFGIFLLGIVMLGTSGCIDIIEEITLKKDGTGTFSTTIDLSRVLQQGLMDQFSGLLEGEEKEKKENTEKEPMEVDSVARFYDIMPDEVKQSSEKPEFWKKVWMKMNISESKNIAKIAFQLDFDKIEEIDYFNRELAKMGKNGKGAGPMGGFADLFGASSQLYKLKKRKLTRLKQPKKDFAKQLGEGGDAEQNMEMAKMMFAGAKYTTVLNLPGKVKKASHPKATISADGKTVTVSQDMIDYMEGRVNFENVIKFKKK